MTDWLSSMQQTYEYYTVDPGTWKDVRLINTVRSSTISRDTDSETLGSASFDMTESIGECYVRTYLVTVQNGVRDRHALGTHLIQTPSTSFNGKIHGMTVDAYTPLLELKEKPIPIGYYIPKGTNIMEMAYRLTRENVRAPVVKAVCDVELEIDFVANTDDTWLTFLRDLIANANYEFDLDEMGRILFAPKQDTASLQPVWTYTDDNSSILYPDITIDHDLYGVPNVVEVVYSSGKTYYHARVVNDDPNSPISTVSRGREIIYRDTNPSVSGIPTENVINDYANNLLRSLSTLEYSLSYSHGYCPVRPNDCIRANYTRAGIRDVKAKVINQSIKCEPGCQVSEQAVFTTKLWR